MGFWLNLFKKKEETGEIDHHTTRSFHMVHHSLNKLQEWIFHLYQHHEQAQKDQQKVERKLDKVHYAVEHDRNHNVRELQELKRWLHQVQHQQSKQDHELNTAIQTVTSLKDDVLNLVESLKNTVEIHDKEISLLKSVPKEPRHSKVTPELRRVTQSDTQNDIRLHGVSVSSSEKKLLSLLCNSAKPLTYNQLSQRIGLNYGTVKNLIYKLRNKGFTVESQLAPEGEKEFYLPKKMKLELTGR